MQMTDLCFECTKVQSTCSSVMRASLTDTH